MNKLSTDRPIEDYLRHRIGCNSFQSVGAFCTCGRDQAAAELERLRGEVESRRENFETMLQRLMTTERERDELRMRLGKLPELAQAVRENAGEGNTVKVSLLSVAMELDDLAALQQEQQA